MAAGKYDPLFKIVVLGAHSAGKTSLILRQSDGAFHASLPASGWDFKVTASIVRNKRVKLQIWDTTTRFRNDVPSSMFRGASGVVLCYDVTDANSFERVDFYRNDFIMHCGANVCAILVGTKCDLTHERVVSEAAAAQYAEENGLQYFETSAKESINVSEAFHWLAEMIYAKSFGGDGPELSLTLESRLLRACSVGNAVSVRDLLKKGADVNSASRSGTTALSAACRAGKTDVVELLLDAGAAINAINSFGDAPITIAAKHKQWKTGEILLCRGASTVSRQTKKSAVCIAIATGNQQMLESFLDRDASCVEAEHVLLACDEDNLTAVNTLLGRGIPVDGLDQRGMTALLLVCVLGRTAIAKTLLDHGASIEATDSEGQTPLMLASTHGRTQTVDMLLERGADTEATDCNGKTALLLAVAKGDARTAKVLLDNKASPAAADNKGLTALIVACSNGDTTTTSVLLDHGAPLEAVDCNGMTALLRAVQSGHIETVKALLDHGASNGAVDNAGMPALLLACKNGGTAIAELLLDRGVSIESVGKDGATALLVAAASNRIQAVEMLLNRGARIEAEDGSGNTALILASELKSAELACILLERGASIRSERASLLLRNLSHKGHTEYAAMVLSHGACIDAPDEDGRTALLLASASGNCKTAEMLLDHGASVSVVDKNGCNALALAMAKWDAATMAMLVGRGVPIVRGLGETILLKAISRGDDSLVETFLNAGVSIEATNDVGQTPLLLAVAKANNGVVQILLERGANMEATDKDGRTAVAVALQKDRDDRRGLAWMLLEHGASAANAECASQLRKTCESGVYRDVCRLLDRGVDIDSRDDRGRTALLLAVHTGRASIVETLLRHGASVEVAANSGVTVLHAASYGGFTSIASMLLEHGAAIEAMDSDGKTPLMSASFNGNKEIVSMLLSNGASLEAVDKEGRTAFCLALIGGHSETAQMLLSRGASVSNLLQHPLPQGALLRVPEKVTIQGANAVGEWLVRSTAKAVKACKLLLLGHGRAGKSTILQRLVNEEITTVEHTPSTAGLSVSGVPFREAGNVDVVAFDFAGQLEYMVSHHMFLSRRNAIFVIVVDSTLGPSVMSVHLGHWIQFVLEFLRVREDKEGNKRQRVVIQMIGSQCDKLHSEAARVTALGCMKRTQREHLEGIDEVILGGPPLLLSGKYGSGFKQARRQIIRALNMMMKDYRVQYVPKHYETTRLALKERVSELPLFLDVAQEFGRSVGVDELMVDEEADAVATYMHNIGVLVLSRDRRMICVRPETLGKLITPFVCPDEHTRAMFLDRRSRDRALVSETEAHAQIRRMCELRKLLYRTNQPLEAQVALNALEQWGICIEVRNDQRRLYGCGEEGRMYMFPALRPSCSMFRLPKRRNSTASVMRAAHAHQLCQGEFNLVQVQMSARWHSHYLLYSNGVIVRSVPSGEKESMLEETAIGMVMMMEGGLMRAVVEGETEDAADELLEFVRQSVHASVDHVQWRQCSEQEAKRMGYALLERMPWSWAGGDKFVHECPEKWRHFDDDLLRRLGMEEVLRNLHRSKRWTYLTPELLRELDMSDATETANRCAQLYHGEEPDILHDVQFTELEPDETSEARRRERARIMHAFDEFVGKDGSKDLEVTKLVVIRNTRLEEQFALCYNDLLEQRGRSPVDREWNGVQKRTLQSLQEYLLRAPGSEGANVIMGWHGAEHQYQLCNAILGFRKFPPVTAEEERRLRRKNDTGDPIDLGFFGRGVYLSQFPSYGRVYASRMDAESTLASTATPGLGAGAVIDRDEQEGLEPLMLCHIVMGRSYPVYEDPFLLPYDENKHGKQCEPGFDSHYALVTGPVSTMVPIKENEAGKADEIVIFNPCQILPYAFVYCSRRRNVEPPSGDRPVLVWVDPNPNDGLERRITENTTTEIRRFVSSAQMWVWLGEHEEKLLPLRERGHLRVVTNRYRPYPDGEDEAASLLVRSVRRCRQWSEALVLIFCGNIGPVIDFVISPPSPYVFVTTDEDLLVRFGAMEPVDAPFFLHHIKRRRIGRLRDLSSRSSKLKPAECAGCQSSFRLWRFRYICAGCTQREADESLWFKCDDCAPRRALFDGVRLCDRCLHDIDRL